MQPQQQGAYGCNHFKCLKGRYNIKVINMISIDRETMIIIAIIACAATTVFLFRELGKTKDELNGVKGFSSKIMNHLVIQDNMIRQNVREIKNEKVPDDVLEEEEVEEKSEE